MKRWIAIVLVSCAPAAPAPAPKPPPPPATAAPSRPIAPTIATTHRTIDLGVATACALGGERGVYCWGTGSVLEAIAGAPRSSVAVAIPGITDAVSVGVGLDHACALR